MRRFCHPQYGGSVASLLSCCLTSMYIDQCACQCNINMAPSNVPYAYEAYEALFLLLFCMQLRRRRNLENFHGTPTLGEAQPGANSTRFNSHLPFSTQGESFNLGRKISTLVQSRVEFNQGSGVENFPIATLPQPHINPEICPV